MGGVMNYEVYRSIDGNFYSSPIGLTTLSNRYFQDDLEPLGDFSGNVCYLIVGNESQNALGFAERSFSNIACGIIEPIVYIPNSFTPGTDGINDLFKPVVTFYDVNNYEFSIVDRWGQVVFQTTDPNQGWNGEHDASGKLVTNDLFCYVLKIKDGNNQEYSFRGTVAVLR
jgi:gliding motility-associated-like protein